MKRKAFSIIFALVLILSLGLLTAVPVCANSVESSTMIFEGDLTDEGGGVYTGTNIPMTAGAYYVEGGGGEDISILGGFDVYAEEGGCAYCQGYYGVGEWNCDGQVDTFIVDYFDDAHDAYPDEHNGGPWGSWYDPDCADWDMYSLELTATHWYLRYTPTDESPMSGIMIWNGDGTGYAAETDLGTQDGGHDGSAAHGGGAQAWDWDCGWGVEVIPLQYLGFQVEVTSSSETYKVTMTPAPYQGTTGFVTGGGWIDSPENAVPLTISNVTVSGLSGDTSTDPDAAYAPYYLRYVGNPPPAGYDPDHNYQWGSPAIFTPSPEDGPVTLQGTIDVDEQTVGQVAMIGLLDADDLAAGNSSFQRGAYIYIYRSSATSWKIGPSDGNVGGEIVQTFIIIADTDLPADGILDVVFTVDGTVDGTTCAVNYPGQPSTASDGCMTLQITGGSVNAILTDNYGDVVGNNSASPEFANGAVLGWDDWIGSNVGFTLTAPGITGGSPEGKASFGFVSRYKKGASEPTGQTEFIFQAAGLNFHSSSYDWLVVNQAGSNAQFKGTGTVNGVGDYKFMLWAGDDDTDTFRIKIWTEDNGIDTVIYDNGMHQPIGGGQIVVHKK